MAKKNTRLMAEAEDFRKALENAAGSAAQLARALRLLWQKLDELASAEYRACGSPFGESEEALEIWLEYEQQTTGN